MRKNLFLIIIASFILTGTLIAQSEQTLLGRSALGFSGAWLDWKTNLSQFGGNYSPYTGFAWGLEFGKALELGGSHYVISNEPTSDGKSFSLTSNGLTARYAVNAFKSVHPVFGAVAGVGNLNIESATSKIFTVEPTVGVEINLLRWFHLDLDGGYRIVAGNKIAGYKDADFSGAFGTLHLKFGWSWGGASYRNGF